MMGITIGTNWSQPGGFYPLSTDQPGKQLWVFRITHIFYTAVRVFSQVLPQYRFLHRYLCTSFLSTNSTGSTKYYKLNKGVVI